MVAGIILTSGDAFVPFSRAFKLEEFYSALARPNLEFSASAGCSAFESITICKFLVEFQANVLEYQNSLTIQASVCRKGKVFLLQDASKRDQTANYWVGMEQRFYLSYYDFLLSFYALSTGKAEINGKGKRKEIL